MNITEAKREFGIRYYRWTISEFEKEIKASSPNLRLFKSGNEWKMYQLIQRLKPNEQLTFARAMVKRWHLSATKALGEVFTDEESSLLEQYDAEFISQPSRLEAEVASRRRAGDKIKFVSKNKLRKVMVAKFITAFGPQCVKMQIGPEWDPLFYMRCCGWFVVTQLWFGRQQSLISHRHSIESETRIHNAEYPDCPGPAMTLDPGLAWPCSGQWEYLMDGEVEAACDAVIRHCGYLFEAAPTLLKGLEFDKIQPTQN